MTAGSLILVVEDNEANQMLVRAVLEREGFEVAVVGSAPEAQDYLLSTRPDLILMDIQLPGMDGMTLSRLLKGQAATSEIPIVALTAHAMQGDREQALEAGCSGYISKPIEVRTFGEQVRAFLAGEAGDRRLVAQ